MGVAFTSAFFGRVFFINVGIGGDERNLNPNAHYTYIYDDALVGCSSNLSAHLGSGDPIEYIFR